MLDVFLLLAFTHLGYECQDLLSQCDGMHVSIDHTLVYTLIWKSFGGMESEPMLNPLKPEAQRQVEPATLCHIGQTTDWAIPAQISEIKIAKYCHWPHFLINPLVKIQHSICIDSFVLNKYTKKPTHTIHFTWHSQAQNSSIKTNFHLFIA